MLTNYHLSLQTHVIKEYQALTTNIFFIFFEKKLTRQKSKMATKNTSPTVRR
jgi:hypothetical protein